MPAHVSIQNGTAAPLQTVPVLAFDAFRVWLLEQIQQQARVAAFFTVTHAQGNQLIAVLVHAHEPQILLSSTIVQESYPALTPDMPCLHLFERELYEQHGIVPQGHPWLKPVRFEQKNDTAIGAIDFFRIGGKDVHEVAVGPIHAGIIECGHFRFQCHGEIVMHLEISLGYHHRGIEQACNSAPQTQTLPLMEVIAGDTSIGHSWAYCTVMEALAGLIPSGYTQQIRAIALELERLANHTGDMGAIAGDIGYLPTSSYCGRLRGDYLNMTALLCGNRFGRGLLFPGGVFFGLDEQNQHNLAQRLAATAVDTRAAVAMLWQTSSVTARMMGKGKVSTQAAVDLGLVGVAAKAAGLSRDVRSSHPLAGVPVYNFTPPVSQDGDVQARASIRRQEIEDSIQHIASILEDTSWAQHETVPAPAQASPTGNLQEHAIAVALIEGWRGEICHVAVTGAEGTCLRYKVVDPSFHNWIGLALALRGQQISDFPLCNKSFNLSYCGHDL